MPGTLIEARHGAGAAVARRWLAHQLAQALLAMRLRSGLRMACVALVLAALAGTGAYLHASLAVERPDHLALDGYEAAGLACVVSLLTALGLYPLVRQRDGWLLRTASQLSSANMDLLSVLGRLTELRGGDTAGHNLRVTAYTVLFAEALNLPPRNAMSAAKGALLHDIGKLVISDRVLGKPGPLTAEEREEMALHVSRGVEVVEQSQFLSDAASVVAAHHEHYDGTGYPRGLKGEDIPREARMFALVDVFDALMSARVYKPALSIDEALAAMADGRGTHFDPLLFDRFVELAPGFAARLPQDEAELVALVTDHLLPPSSNRLFRRVMPD
jgi:putative nucleotidyltransferase with HDIG domain